MAKKSRVWDFLFQFSPQGLNSKFLSLLLASSPDRTRARGATVRWQAAGSSNQAFFLSLAEGSSQPERATDRGEGTIMFHTSVSTDLLLGNAVGFLTLKDTDVMKFATLKCCSWLCKSPLTHSAFFSTIQSHKTKSMIRYQFNAFIQLQELEKLLKL